jgi:hypothetical protein
VQPHHQRKVEPDRQTKEARTLRLLPLDDEKFVDELLDYFAKLQEMGLDATAAVALAPKGRLTDADTMGRIERFQQEMGLDAKELQKKLRRKKSSLVVALGKDYLWCGIEWLKRDFGFDAKVLRTFFQCNSVVFRRAAQSRSRSTPCPA